MSENEMTFRIDAETGRIDKVLSDLVPDASRSQLQAWIKEGHVRVNGEAVKVNYKVQEGDVVTVTEPEPETLQVEPEDIPLDIVYEDKDVLVVNKPSGMVVHPSKGHVSGTLVNALLFHVQTLSAGTENIRPGIVHRIDKDTSGLLVVAKNNLSHQRLAEQFEAHTIEREYLALVHGEISHEEGTIEAPIARKPNDRLKRTVIEGGREAITHFRRLEVFPKYTLVRLQLETGRTHQIRVHMKYIGHPLVGDPMYGPSSSIDINGQFLHAGVLGFNHPTTGERLRFEVPLPDFFQRKLEELRRGN